MHIGIEWHGNQFNLSLASKEGNDAFLVIKGCRIVESKNGGSFISYPARKNEETGKWWNHVWGGERFNEAVMEKAKESMPQPNKPKDKTGGLADMDDDICF